jgi:hypothetical protein
MDFNHLDSKEGDIMSKNPRIPVRRAAVAAGMLFVLASFALPAPGWPAAPESAPNVSDSPASSPSPAAGEKGKRITLLGDAEFKRKLHLSDPEQILSPGEQEDLQQLVKQRSGSTNKQRCHIIACIVTADGGVECWYHCV